MRNHLLLFVLAALQLPLNAFAVAVTEDINIEGQYIRLEMSPAGGGVLHTLALAGKQGNFAGSGGLLQEGFGVGSDYLPNRRLNEKLEVLEEFADRPVLRYSYECQGPNIQGLQVSRTMEPLPNEASIKVTWRIENGGKDRQWVAPWVRNDITPGGAVDAQDRFDLPTHQGIIQASKTSWYPASRNWYAATDPAALETLFCVFHADQTHSFLALWDEERPGQRAIQTAFVPFFLEPGKSWETTYRVGAVQGLRQVDFASDELAAQISTAPNALALLLSPVRTMPGLEIETRAVAPNGRVWKLPRKKFDLAPAQLARCSYEWTAPADGAYDLLAQVERDGASVLLGKETGSPHGGIDTQFVIGRPKAHTMEPWTDASHALDKGPRTLQRPLLARGDVEIWAESSLEKIFRTDQVQATGSASTVKVSLAANERESFQIVVRPVARRFHVSAAFSDFVNTATNVTLPASAMQACRVDYMSVPIPSHFEGPTGSWPDALPPLAPFNAEPGFSYPLWFTMHAPAGTPPGTYLGKLSLANDGQAPIEVLLEVEVFPFELPRTPALKTDFGFWMEAALAGSKLQGGKAAPDALGQAYLQNALEHRVTLRELTRFPEPRGAGYAAALAAFEPRLKELLKQGVTTFAVPGSLLQFPAELQAANDFVKRLNLQGRAFVPFASEPPEPTWPRLLEALQQWHTAAPDIPVMVTTAGVKPFVPASVDLRALHAQVFDTGNNVDILNSISSGRETWWYVANTPPRPYGNFFVDFAAIEHRILFWQSWALGVRGMHYWNVNYFEPDQNPWRTQLDATPVNGDGFLVYPGANGPVNSIRWEVIRDGIEDYDYLALLLKRRDALVARGGNEALLGLAAKAYNLTDLVPTLVGFPRDPQVLERKREEIARMIVKIDEALAR